MESAQDEGQDIPVVEPWPSPWGDDPTTRWTYSNASPDLYRHKDAVQARKTNDWQPLVDLWRSTTSWERDEKSKELGSLAVLEGAMYLASQNKEQYLSALIAGFEENLFPATPVDAWKERWRRDGFVRFLCEAPRDTSAARLADLVLDRWPWAFAWAGQENQNFRHPLAMAVRKGNFDFAEKMMAVIEPETWLDWSAYYEMNSIWKDRYHWREQDPSWVLKLCQYDPRLKKIDPKTGYGLVETAARDYLPDMVKSLLDHGIEQDPMQSFGLTLSHWALHKVIESSWDRQRNEYVPKSPNLIEQDALRCGRTLGSLAAMGFGMDVPVAKVPKVPGVRRPRGLPKPPETAAGFMERLRTTEKLSDSTVATIGRGYLETGPVPTPPVAAVAPRKRL